MSAAPELFPFQAVGADWLAPRRTALLADEMGLGKSAQAIVAADIANLQRVLVLCPAIGRENWRREFEKFSIFSRPLDVVKPGKPYDPSASIVCSYGMASELKASGWFDLLILDEAHFLKSTDAQRTSNALGKTGWVRRAGRTWALTGTPSPNGDPSEMWVLLYTFGVTKLKYREFLDYFCNWIPLDKYDRVQVTGPKRHRIPELRALLATCMLRRKIDDVMPELPPISFTDITVEASPVDIDTESSFVQYVFPTDRRQELREKLAEERYLVENTMEHVGLNSFAAMKALEALAGSVSTLRRFTGLQKVPDVVEMVKEELINNAYDKIVIFAIHRDVIEGLRVGLKKFKPVTLYGGTNESTRIRNIDNFQNSPAHRVFIGNIQACGTSITLTAANQILFIEQEWVPGHNAQAAMRCRRIGQKRPVFVRFVGMADSIDEKISQVIKRKTRDAIAIFDV